MGWQVSSAVIALKQGAGCLIRDRHDRGVPVLCGPAPLGERLRQTFMASLPPMPRTRDLADVQAFFNQSGSEPVSHQRNVDP